MVGTQWLTVRMYAKRGNTFHGREARVLAQVTVIYLFPSNTVLKLIFLHFSMSPGWSGAGFHPRPLRVPVSCFWVTRFFMRWIAYSSVQLAMLANLPGLCPNVTSFSAIVGSQREYELLKK